MKKIFTLLACVLMAGSAFGQEKWTTIFSQDLENDFSDPNMEFFECSERHGAARGPVRIVEDPDNPANHCIKVIVRSDAEAEAEGDRQTEGGWGGQPVHLISWDTQFFIYFKEKIPAGMDIRLTMNAKGEKEGSFQFQTHEYPQNYIYYQLFPGADDGGNVLSYTTQWAAKPYKKEDVVSTDASPSDNFQCIALNMTCDPYDGNVVYLDNFKVEIREHKTEEFSGWFNLLRNGTLSDDEMILPNGEKKPTVFTTFTSREGGVSTDDTKTRIVNDPLDGQPALTLTSVGYNATYDKVTQVKVQDEDGNDVLDADGNPTYRDSIEVVQIHIRERGDTIRKNDGSYGLEDWTTQFFVSSPHKFKRDEQYKLVMHYRADKPVTVQTQIHNGPGDYLHYEMLGDLNFTEEWQDLIIDENNVKTITSQQAGGTTLAFNCNVEKDVVNYYFRFDEFSCNVNAITPEERSLKKQEVIASVPEPDKESNFKVDLSEMVKVLKIDDLTAFLNDNTMRVLLVNVEGEGDDQVITETLSGAMQATTGVYVDNTGSFTDEEDGISISFPEEGIEGNEVTLNVYNLNAVVEKGKPITAKLYFEDATNWFYGIDVVLMNPEDYETGIVEVKQVKADNGLIYNIAGQRVDGSYKGLVIKNGQKFVQK